jgi:ABC-type multidrug transport system fused ATPase/permease subunit
MLDMRMVVALASFVMAVTAGLIWFGEPGRPLHRNYSSKAAAVGGDLIEIISNMWTVKAFSARVGNGIGYAIRRNRRRWFNPGVATPPRCVRNDLAGAGGRTC